jgi:8-oxo-dGTP pyrophosphatase MutT (NUDIX family)
VRETLEETGWDVELTGVVGIYLYTAPSNGVTYQRICFAARPCAPPGLPWTATSSAPCG